MPKTPPPSVTSYDPLGPATRAIKKNLLIASLVAITFKTFSVKIEQIPLVGFAIKFEHGLFDFLMLVVLVYLLITFVLYYYIDIKNFPVPPHEAKVVADTASKISSYSSQTYERMSEALRRVVSSPFRANLDREITYYLIDVDNKRTALSIDDLAKFIEITKPGENDWEAWQTVLPNEQPHLFLNGANAIYAIAHDYRKDARINRMRMRIWRTSVITAYRVRNYLVDGGFPIVSGVLAIATIYDVVSFQWLSAVLPEHPK